MKKRVIAMAVTALMATGILAGCGGSSEGGDTATQGKETLKVGMITDSGTIDDKSFNQGTWEGVIKAEKDLENVKSQYLKPAGETEADYLKEITNIYDAGNRVIVTPGFKFETAIYKAQEKYKDSKFVLLDGSPKADPDAAPEVADNTVSIFYAEHESGFLAGLATALEVKEGDVGFIGGLEIPPVQKFNWGYQQGIAYANENYGTSVTIKEENIQYANSFVDTAVGTQMAAAMYDRGVKAVFASAGKVGVGVITEAKTRVAKGENVWVIGVDVDQYQDGVYEGDKSVVLTSATKKIGKSAFEMIEHELKGTFPGGETLVFDIKTDDVGLPEKNPNLSEDTLSKVSDVIELMKKDEVKVISEKEDAAKAGLIK